MCVCVCERERVRVRESQRERERERERRRDLANALHIWVFFVKILLELRKLVQIPFLFA